MPEQTDPPHEPVQPPTAGPPEATGLPRDVESQVRRLLREARHDEPVPVEVVERLEHALAVEAEAAAAGRPASAPVLPLAQRRRRRAVALLVAAVAIVVIGVGVDQVLRPAVDGTATSASDVDDRVAAAQASRSGAPERGTAPGDDPGDDAGPADGSSAGTGGSTVPPSEAPQPVAPRAGAAGSAASPRPLLLAGDPPAVRSTRFAADVRAVRRDVAGLPRPARTAPSGDFSCEGAAWGPGRAVATLLDGTSSVLVVRPAAGETQVVDLLQCGSGEVLRSVTLPAR